MKEEKNVYSRREYFEKQCCKEINNEKRLYKKMVLVEGY